MAGQIKLQYNPPLTTDEVGQDSNVSDTMTRLGFYSLIGLLRMHCLVNDYRTAVKVLDLVDLRKKSFISKIDNCHITAHYYLAVCYLMTKRWVDCYNVCVSVISRYQENKLKNETKNIDDKVEGYKNKNEGEFTDKEVYHEQYLTSMAMLLRCCALLAMTYVLNNKTQRLDNILLDKINHMFGGDLDEIADNSFSKRYKRKSSKNKDGDKKESDNNEKHKGDDSKKNNDEEDENKSDSNENESDSIFERKKEAFQNLFFLGCPDYPNTFDLFVDTEAARIASSHLKSSQFEKFFRLVNLHKSYEISRMRDEIKLYRAIPAQKLAKQLEFGDSNAFEKELIQLKSRMRQFKRVDGVSSNGEWSTQSDFDFFIKKDDVNVRRVDGSRLGRYTQAFVSNIVHAKDFIFQNDAQYVQTPSQY